MGSTVKKIALLSGGGDCPGLNAVIRTITKTAISKYGYDGIGFVYGYRGLFHNNYVELTEESVEDIYKEGGTILYSSNKDNLFDYLVDDGHGGKVKKDVSDVAVENLKKDLDEKVATYSAVFKEKERLEEEKEKHFTALAAAVELPLKIGLACFGFLPPR